jgi:signal transduction histidine kinase/CheY-like chemotaxis protein
MIANIYWNLVTPLSLDPKIIVTMRWFTGAAMLVVILSILISYVTQINNLLRTAENLKDASERKSVFLREVFHEIRTPMNAIFSISQLFTLNRSTTRASNNKEIDQLFAACYLTRNIINHVLEMARIESGNFYTVKKEPILLRDCVSHCIAVNSYLAASRGIQIRSEVDEELNLPINSDSLILTKIFNNILSNAVKFADGNSWIEFRCTLKGREILFSVTNEGAIDSETADKMFSRFFSKREQFEGTGLGLSIVKHLISLLGGEISLGPFDRANPTKTTMLFTIPYERGNGKLLKYSLSQFRRGCFSGAKVLVIDDDVTSSELLSKLLKEMGVIPTICTEVDNIKELVEINSPNLIISDLNMPKINGKQIIQHLRNDTEVKSIPIIIISGDAFQKDEVLTAGADAFIIKPVLIRELYLELAKHFQHHLLS